MSEDASSVSRPKPARNAAAGTTDDRMPMTPKSRPISTPTRSFAASTRPRRGVARKVGVSVLWRNSVVTISVPMSSGNT